MMSLLKLAFICLIVAAVLKEQTNAASVKDVAASNLENDNAEDEKHGALITKKPNVFQSFANSLIQNIPNPLTPFTQPLVNIQNIFKPRIRPVVTSIKTIVIEVTKRVVRHPVCIASAIGVKPCGEHHTPHGSIGYHNNPHKISYKESDKETQNNAQELVEELYMDDFKNEGLFLEPSATVKMSLEPSADSPEIIDEELPTSRTRRYLKFAQETPAIEDVKSAIEEGQIDDSYESDGSDDMGKYLYRKPETKIITSTAWVTRVQKVTDYRVTATLVPKNCIPADLNFPHCSHAVPHPLIWKNEGETEEEGKVETPKSDESSDTTK